MARLVEAAEARFETDFGIVDALQDDGLGDTPGTFASGTSGGVVMAAGTRNADAFVRVERWDAEPPEPPEHVGWEDRDTVVFHELPGWARTDPRFRPRARRSWRVDRRHGARAGAGAGSRSARRPAGHRALEASGDAERGVVVELYPDPQGGRH